jgi:hypothetical protein
LLLAAAAIAQSVDQHARKPGNWSFQHYPAVLDFTGQPAGPKIVTSIEHKYRTQIREQAQKGPNFAGHFTLANWGCGSPCLEFVIINAISGAIYDPDFTVGCANRNVWMRRLTSSSEVG